MRHHLLQEILHLCPITSVDQLAYMCSPKHIHLNVYVILFLNSSCLQYYHREFKGNVRIYSKYTLAFIIYVCLTYRI
jgi:hypothetical protein